MSDCLAQKENQNNKSDKEETNKKGTIIKNVQHFYLVRDVLLLLSVSIIKQLFPIVPDEEKHDINVVISRRFLRLANVSILKIRDQKSKCHYHLLNDQEDNKYNDEKRYEEMYAIVTMKIEKNFNFPDKKSDEEKSEAANYSADSFGDFVQMLNHEGHDIVITRL
ncbi:hypothetical protein Glove_230g59 [Diversispora epigaea]|uniref:Uncharacterized protein n=1 Tax=Diversispora epigaea TaxID=1348612 RepID=A0A397ICZ4_9GLOM|nr:hypothetical protein Glove_230g59 [Diversispora epigaea]